MAARCPGDPMEIGAMPDGSPSPPVTAHQTHPMLNSRTALSPPIVVTSIGETRYFLVPESARLQTGKFCHQRARNRLHARSRWT